MHLVGYLYEGNLCHPLYSVYNTEYYGEGGVIGVYAAM
jgi:hypothetical protein